MKLLSFVIAFSMLICAVSAVAEDDLFIDEPEVDENAPLNVENLMSIVGHGDVKALKPYLDAKFDFNVRDEDGETPLTLAAAYSGSVEMMQALLKGGAKIDFPDKDGQTALMRGCLHQNMVDFLLKAGADIHAKDKEGWTMLFHAAWRDNSTFFRYLLDKGLNVNARNKNGDTLLITLVGSTTDEIFQMLIDAGADLHAKNKDGHTAMWHALAYCCKDYYQILSKAGAKPEVHNEYARRAMNMLKRIGFKNPDLLLMDEFIPIQELDTDGRTFLRWAAKNGQSAIVKQLLDNKAAVNAPDYYGGTALLNAIREGHTEIALALIKAGANVNHKDKEGEFPLNLALINNDLPVFDALIETGADINLWKHPHAEDDKTPLMYALECESLKIAKKLIAAGVKTDFKTEEELTALHLVLLCEDAPFEERNDLIQMLLDAELNVNEPNSDGETPLHMAFYSQPLQREEQAIILNLLVAGADPNAPNIDGITPFMLAVVVDSPPSIIRQMLNKGARVNEMDEDGDTALIMAAANGNEETVKLLIDAGADVNAKNGDNETALSLALEEGYDGIVKLLKDAGAKE